MPWREAPLIHNGKAAAQLVLPIPPMENLLNLIRVLVMPTASTIMVAAEALTYTPLALCTPFGALLFTEL